MIFRRRKFLPEVTLICVAGVDLCRAVRALFISISRVKFAEVVLVTPNKDLLSWLNFFRIKVESPFDSKLDSMKEYNRYIVFDLYRHVATSHCLLIQADGYVQHPSSWSDDFLSYDYIGAPWPIKKDSYVTPFGEHVQVGNGGFSLRSKKLLEVPLKYSVTFEVNTDSFYKHFNKNSYSEDGVICVHNRHVYVNGGCEFAPLEISARFSRELEILGLTNKKTFGFHRYK